MAVTGARCVGAAWAAEGVANGVETRRTNCAEARALGWWATDGRFGAFGRTSVSTGTGAAGVVFAAVATGVGVAAGGSAGTLTVMLCVVAVGVVGVVVVAAGGEDVVGDVAVGSVTTGGAGVTGTVVPGSLEAGGVAAGSAAVGSGLVADGSVVAAGAVADGSGGVAAGSVVADGSVVAAGAVAVGSDAAGAVGSAAVVEVESVDVDVDDCDGVAVESAVPEPVLVVGSDVAVAGVPDPLSAAAGCANVTAKATSEATSTTTRSRVRRSESTPTFPLPVTPHLPLPHPCPATRHVHYFCTLLLSRPTCHPTSLVDARTVKTSQQSGRKRCNIRPCRPRGEAAVDAFQRGGSVRMVEKLRLGRRLAVGAAVIFGILFAVVGQGAHRAAAIGLDASVVSISGSPEVPEGSTAQFTATISPAATGDFDVDYTASAGGVSGSFHVTAGDATEQVNVATQDDGTVTPQQRTFTVTLADTNDPNGSTVDPTPATGTLDNIDQPPPSVVSIGNANAPVIEGSPATFPVSITPAAGVAFNVSYTASAGGVSSSFHVNQGATSMQVPVATVDNGTPEDDKTFTVTLNGTDATNGSTVSGTPGTGTIIDNDWTITLSPINPAAVSEQGGSIQFAATLNGSAPQQHAISVHYAVADGSAVLGTNYTVSQAASGTLTFAAGQHGEDRDRHRQGRRHLPRRRRQDIHHDFVEPAGGDHRRKRLVDRDDQRCRHGAAAGHLVVLRRQGERRQPRRFPDPRAGLNGPCDRDVHDRRGQHDSR